MGGEDTTEGRCINVSDLPCAIRIEPFAPQHASAAARLHVAGQPGTFLTSLGSDVLEVVYAALPRSGAGFGFVAIREAVTPDAIVGFVSATTSTGRLFADTGVRHAGKLLPPLFARFAARPALIGRSMQTVLYPILVRDQRAGEDGSSAELLSIMVEQKWRRRGVGGMLLGALIAECSERGIAQLDVTVDADNVDARNFYTRNAFHNQKSFRLYGRQMCQYGRRV